MKLIKNSYYLCFMPNIQINSFGKYNNYGKILKFPKIPCGILTVYLISR